jgi:hypothetical protein
MVYAIVYGECTRSEFWPMVTVLWIRKYFFRIRIRGSVILIYRYGSRSWRQVTTDPAGSGSYLDVFVRLPEFIYFFNISTEWSRSVIQNYGSVSRRPINYGSTEYGSGYTPLGEEKLPINIFGGKECVGNLSLYNVVHLLIFMRCRESNQEC